MTFPAQTERTNDRTQRPRNSASNWSEYNKWFQAELPYHAFYCRVLTSGEFRGMILEPLNSEE